MTDNQKYQYEKLIAARNYHYENLNKWLAFFYVAIGAVFAGYCKLLTGHACPLLLSIILIVGYVISLAAYLSCKGYYYWELNWIMLLHDLEKNNLYKDQRVYSVFANVKGLDKPLRIREGANVSTTKVALVLTFVITGTFGAMLFYEIGPFSKVCCNVVFSIITSAFFSWTISLIGAKALKSNLSGLDDLELPID